MQQHLLQRRLHTGCGCVRPLTCSRPALLRPLHASSHAASRPEQPSTSGAGDGEASASTLPLDTVEATVLEPGSEAASHASGSTQAASESAEDGDAADTLEASLSGEELEEFEGEWDQPAYPEVPESTGRMAQWLYLAVGAAHLAAAGITAFAALRSPGLLLPAAAVGDPWASTLLGCLAATHLRAAGVFNHLRAAASNDELLCWRHQRLAAVTALYGMLAAATQAFGAASPQLAGMQLALAAASAGVIAFVARSAWSVAPFVSWVAVTAAAEGGSPGAWAVALWREAREAVSSITGLLLLAVAGLSLYGFAQTALAPAPSPMLLLGGWPGAPPEALAGWAVGLRRLVGAGMLLGAAQAAALLDFTGVVWQPRGGGGERELEEFKLMTLEGMIRTRDPMCKYYLPDPATYGPLNLALLLATVTQAAFVAAAPAAGVNVNWDASLWGPLYGTCMLGLSYVAAVWLQFDWAAAYGLVGHAFMTAGNLVLDFFNAFVWKFQWAEKTKRV